MQQPTPTTPSKLLPLAVFFGLLLHALLTNARDLLNLYMLHSLP